eukprot:scaffold13775_cov105-Isochrysis_galbana.AAC.2
MLSNTCDVSSAAHVVWFTLPDPLPACGLWVGPDPTPHPPPIQRAHLPQARRVGLDEHVLQRRIEAGLDGQPLLGRPGKANG